MTNELIKELALAQLKDRLKRVAEEGAKLENMIAELEGVAVEAKANAATASNGAPTVPGPVPVQDKPGRTYKMSPEARAKIAEAQRRRWAKAGEQK